MRRNWPFIARRTGPAVEQRFSAHGSAPAVQRTARQVGRQPGDSAGHASRAGRPGGACKTAVATPVLAGLCPPQTYRTPIVAPGVATAGHPVITNYARLLPRHSEEERV